MRPARPKRKARHRSQLAEAPGRGLRRRDRARADQQMGARSTRAADRRCRFFTLRRMSARAAPWRHPRNPPAQPPSRCPRPVQSPRRVRGSRSCRRHHPAAVGLAGFTASGGCGDALADADAHGDGRVATAAAVELANGGDSEPRAQRGPGMADGDRAALGIDARIVERHVQQLDAAQRLARERLVQLDHIHVLKREAGTLQRLRARGYRAEADRPVAEHPHRRRHDPRHRLHARLLAGSLGADDEGCRAIVDAQRVPRHHHAALVQRLQFREPLERRVGARMLVLIDGRGGAFFQLDRRRGEAPCVETRPPWRARIFAAKASANRSLSSRLTPCSRATSSAVSRHGIHAEDPWRSSTGKARPDRSNRTSWPRPPSALSDLPGTKSRGSCAAHSGQGELFLAGGASRA